MSCIAEGFAKLLMVIQNYTTEYVMRKFLSVSTVTICLLLRHSTFNDGIVFKSKLRLIQGQ